MSSHFTHLDWLILLGYFAGTMSLGFYFHRRSSSAEGFTAANRSLPGWVCGLSIFATFVSSISFLALPGKSFLDNWNPFVFSLSIPLATWIGVRWFVPYYRRSGEVSAYALLECRFGTWARVYASLCYLLTQVARMGVIMYLLSLTMAMVFGWDMRVTIVATGICVTVYSFVGGIVAVIWSDAIQAVVLMAGAAVCLVSLMVGVEGGAAEVFRIGWQNEKFSLGSFGPAISESTFWVVLLYGLFINLQNFGIDQSYVQRYVASSSEAEARKSLWLGGLLYLPVSALFFLLGTSLFAFYTANAGELPEVKQIVVRQRMMQESGVWDGYESDSVPTLRAVDRHEPLAAQLASVTMDDVADGVFPHFIAKHLPPGVTGLLVAAIFAAAMSTVSTSLNSSSTLVLRDYYQRFANPHATDEQSMTILHAATIGWGILGTGMALILVNITESALDIWWELASIFSGGMLGLFLLGMLVRAANSRAALTGVALGVAVIAWMVFSPPLWGRIANEAQLQGNSHRSLAVDRGMVQHISPGDTAHLRYSWYDEQTDRRRSIQESRRIADVRTGGQEISVTKPLTHQPLGPVAIFDDSGWYRWRSPFHSYLAIVIGTCVVLLTGAGVASMSQWCFAGKQCHNDRNTKPTSCTPDT